MPLPKADHACPSHLGDMVCIHASSLGKNTSGIHNTITHGNGPDKTIDPVSYIGPLSAIPLGNIVCLKITRSCEFTTYVYIRSINKHRAAVTVQSVSQSRPAASIPFADAIGVFITCLSVSAAHTNGYPRRPWHTPRHSLLTIGMG
ncbi:MAG: hypothetical protein MZU84_02305 [Sphingobacterium sp.]|nr:hypothetical protein [Sphingobacterium sp.]